MIILIGAEKGGTGKTTLATNLSAMRSQESSDVLLMDTDPQGSATFWSRIRDESLPNPQLTCVQKFGRIDREIGKLRHKYEDIIIDAGGRDSDELRTGMTVADKIFIPLLPSQFDVWTISKMATMVEQASVVNPKLRAFIVLNRAPTNPSISEIGDAKDVLTDQEAVSMSMTIIRDRIIFRKVAREGLSVLESKNPDHKAILEIQSLYSEVFSNEE